MKLLKILATATATLSFAGLAHATPADENAIAHEITKSMERFYGQPIESAHSFLSQRFGVKGPMKQEGNSFVYMLPATNPVCGELKLDVTGNAITSWQTITWQRTEDHQPGRACDKAFKEKVGSL